MNDIGQILKSTLYCNIATVCEDGQSWNSPVFFVYDGENFYWWSNQKAVHSRNIQRDPPRVFITVYDSTVPESEAKAAYFQAKAQLLDESEIDRVTKMYNQRAKLFQLDEKITGGEAPTRLFVARPEKIWLNAEGNENGYYVDTRKQII